MDRSARASTLPSASFDSVVLAAVLTECAGLARAGVQRVHQTAVEEIVLSLRSNGRNRPLLISVHPQWGRLHLTHRTPPGTMTGFGQLLRSRLEGATLRTWDAPPFERLVVFTFDTLEGPLDLIVEIMGRHGNLILCDRGVIVGALKSMRLDRARGREVLPQRPYVRPAPPRTTPSAVTAADLLGGPHDRPAWRAVLEGAGGIGPALAWEACMRAGVPTDAPLDDRAAGDVAAVLHQIGADVLTRRFSPVLYRDAQGQPAAFAAFPLRVFSRWRAEPMSMNAAVESVTTGLAERAARDAMRRGFATTVHQATSRVARALEAVMDDERSAADADRLREHGDLILAYLGQVSPPQSSLEVPAFDGTPVRIALNPRLSGVENAQAYFRRYTRAAAARKRLPGRRKALEAERAFLETTATALDQAEDIDDLYEIEQDLVAAGLRRPARGKRRPPAATQGRTFHLTDGLLVRVGRSARDNERLTFEVAGPDDLWLHARGMPGAHVIVSGGPRRPLDAAIAAAAAIAAYYSAGRHAGKVPVDITKRRHVRKIRGAPPGQVAYTDERTVVVAPALPEADTETGTTSGKHHTT